MTIYNIFDYAETTNEFEEPSPFLKEKTSKDNYIQAPSSKKDAFLSAFLHAHFSSAC